MRTFCIVWFIAGFCLEGRVQSVLGGLFRVGSLQGKINKHTAVGVNRKLTSCANLSMPSSVERILIPQLVCGVE